MRELAAIIEPAFDFEQNTRSILKEHIALLDDERNADAHERKSVGFREAAARRRLELGRMLIASKRSIKHGGWLPYLEKLGIDPRNAQNWMALAGYAESKNETQADVSYLPNAPTLADAGIDKRPRKRDEIDRTKQPNLTRSERAEPEPRQSLDIDRELYRLHSKIVAFAESCPVSARKQIAHELRQLANTVDNIKD